MPDRPEQTEYDPKLPDDEFLKKQNEMNHAGLEDLRISGPREVLSGETEAGTLGEEMRPKDDSVDEFPAR